METILAALKQLNAHDVLLYSAIYIVSPMVAFMHVQFHKKHYRGLDKDGNERKLSHAHLRTIASVSGGIIALFIGYQMGGLTLPQALNHAVVVGVSFPLIMWAVMEYIKSKWPNAYDRLRQNKPKKPADKKPKIDDKEPADDDTFTGSGSWWR